MPSGNESWLWELGLPANHLSSNFRNMGHWCQFRASNAGFMILYRSPEWCCPFSKPHFKPTFAFFYVYSQELPLKCHIALCLQLVKPTEAHSCILSSLEYLQFIRDAYGPQRAGGGSYALFLIARMWSGSRELQENNWLKNIQVANQLEQRNS